MGFLEIPGNHKRKQDCEKHACRIVLRRSPPDDVEFLQQQQELLPGALAVGGVKPQGFAAILGT